MDHLELTPLAYPRVHEDEPQPPPRDDAFQVCSRCGWDVCGSDVADHLLVCSSVARRCPACLSFRTSVRKDLERHMSMHCPAWEVMCQLCGVFVPRADFSLHYEMHDQLSNAFARSMHCDVYLCPVQTSPGADHERHMQRCLNGALVCLSCLQEMPCRARLASHDCSGPLRRATGFIEQKKKE